MWLRLYLAAQQRRAVSRAPVCAALSSFVRPDPCTVESLGPRWGTTHVTRELARERLVSAGEGLRAGCMYQVRKAMQREHCEGPDANTPFVASNYSTDQVAVPKRVLVLWW